MENFLLSTAKINQQYKIVGMCEDIDIKTKTRLLELGFFSGELVKVIAKSIKGGVLLVEIRGSVLTVRVNEASCVMVK